ncbi:3-oxoacyl-[acyl-carrier-protein] synthase 3 [Edwardsiella tarda]|nr:3-oxoacyl-[acyl-carrier-protein] synthase 3 [Edwardsiella tarda]
MVETSDEWIVSRTGIRERRIAAPDESVATMAFEAAKHALEMAQVDKDDIGLIIVATTSANHAFPSAACEVQNLLGMRNGCPAFDVAAACAGFTYALSIADQYIKGGRDSPCPGDWLRCAGAYRRSARSWHGDPVW